MKFLICVEGSQAADEAARLGEQLGQLAHVEVTRFRVVDSQREAERHKGTDSLVRVGNPAQEILAEAKRGNFDLIIVGAHTRPRFAELFMGSTASRLARQSPIPLLVVKRGIPHDRPLTKILVCTGGEAPGAYSAGWGGRVAAWTGAELTILHVMSQVALTSKSKFDDLDDTAEEAIRQNTREGMHLQTALDLAQAAGVVGEIRAKIRHGSVLEEILVEVESGGYDLVVIGAHYIPGDDPFRGLLLDDLTDQIISQCPKNVLVVRYKP